MVREKIISLVWDRIQDLQAVSRHNRSHRELPLIKQMRYFFNGTISNFDLNIEIFNTIRNDIEVDIDIEINSIRYWAYNIYIEKYRKKYWKIGFFQYLLQNFSIFLSIFISKNIKRNIEKLVSLGVFWYLYKKYHFLYK